MSSIRQTLLKCLAGPQNYRRKRRHQDTVTESLEHRLVLSALVRYVDVASDISLVVGTDAPESITQELSQPESIEDIYDNLDSLAGLASIGFTIDSTSTTGPDYAEAHELALFTVAGDGVSDGDLSGEEAVVEYEIIPVSDDPDDGVDFVILDDEFYFTEDTTLFDPNESFVDTVDVVAAADDQADDEFADTYELEWLGSYDFQDGDDLVLVDVSYDPVLDEIYVFENTFSGFFVANPTLAATADPFDDAESVLVDSTVTEVDSDVQLTDNSFNSVTTTPNLAGDDGAEPAEDPAENQVDVAEEEQDPSDGESNTITPLALDDTEIDTQDSYGDRVVQANDDNSASSAHASTASDRGDEPSTVYSDSPESQTAADSDPAHTNSSPADSVFARMAHDGMLLQSNPLRIRYGDGAGTGLKFSGIALPSMMQRFQSQAASLLAANDTDADDVATEESGSDADALAAAIAAFAATGIGWHEFQQSNTDRNAQKPAAPPRGRRARSERK